MAEQVIKTLDLTTLSTSDIVQMSSFDGELMYIDIVGSGLTSEDAAFDFVQSNDRTNWSVITFQNFTGTNAHQVKNFTAEGLYLGVQLTNKNTETTGSVVLNIVSKR